jgi:hypothetical protein
LVDKLGGKAEISLERVDEISQTDAELLFGFNQEENSVVLQILSKEEVAELVAKEAEAQARAQAELEELEEVPVAEVETDTAVQ